MKHVPNATEKIVFDKCHIAAYSTKAVDLTRRETMRDRLLDRRALKGTKYTWLRNLPTRVDFRNADLEVGIGIVDIGERATGEE